MDEKNLLTLIRSLKIVSAYIITNRDVLEPDYLTRCEIVREDLMDLIEQLTEAEVNR